MCIAGTARPQCAGPEEARRAHDFRNKALQAALSFDTEGRLIMKFTTDVVRAGEGGRPDVLHRTTVEEISQRRAKTKADQLFRA
jgi:hypothetical protein